MKVITTRATVGTVKRWASSGTKRQRAKYKHALTVCRVVHRRDAPVLFGGLDWEHVQDGYRAWCFEIRFSWGSGYVRTAVTSWGNQERSNRWWKRPERRGLAFRLPSLGWYDRGCGGQPPLTCWADARRWLRGLITPKAGGVSL